MGGQFIALRPPSILAEGNGVILIHVKIKAATSGGAATEIANAGSASAGNVAAAVGVDTTTEASQPPRGSRKAEVVATCINKMLYDSGDAILDPGLATDSIRNTPDCISEVPEAMHEARSRIRDRDE